MKTLPRDALLREASERFPGHSLTQIVFLFLHATMDETGIVVAKGKDLQAFTGRGSFAVLEAVREIEAAGYLQRMTERGCTFRWQTPEAKATGLRLVHSAADAQRNGRTTTDHDFRRSAGGLDSDQSGVCRLFRDELAAEVERVKRHAKGSVRYPQGHFGFGNLTKARRTAHELLACCARTGRSIEDVVERAVRGYVEHERQRSITNPSFCDGWKNDCPPAFFIAGETPVITPVLASIPILRAAAAPPPASSSSSSSAPAMATPEQVTAELGAFLKRAGGAR